MKWIIWILLFISAVAQPMSKTGIYMLFQANRIYISSTLCEQRQIPASTCQGKCFLKKELQKESEREKQLPSGKHAATDLIVVAPAIAVSIPWLTSKEDEKYASYIPSFYPTLTHSIFHPPQLLT
ncbi:hypothetical protein ABID22_002488 [Pontibacter aydingkolensis]|uniref:Uncharacterized protein n=1 Tax=Pontibacter aydingkolensis TaxID=1911536 RepID=A0ABS7CWE3_9BACT|nr:hypothetical protein [Pontibacter aydingkolensis]MBW7468179.1 hypothetical protein [Pontibacter aydingkolensis]